MRIDRPVTQRQCWWLLATALCALAPLARELPPWVLGAATAALTLRALLTWRQWRLPPRWLLVPVTLLAVAAVVWYFRTLLGRVPGIALLTLLLALKLLETRIARDALTIVLLAYFLVLAQFMFDQSIPAGLLGALTVVVTTATLAAASDDRPPPLWLLRRSGLMLLQGLPFMLVLFVLFPRIDGPLWGLPQDRHSATSGLSDSMTPGSIAELAQSDAVAFRVRFEGAVPAQPQLYWRGPVMSEFDGRQWRVGERRIAYDAVPYAIDASAANAVRYELTLEPHGQAWLMALEMPSAAPAYAGLTSDLQIVAREPVRNRLRYRQTAVPDTAFGQQATRAELAAALRLPTRGNPRIRALAAQWRVEAEAAASPGELPKVGAGDTAPGASRSIAPRRAPARESAMTRADTRVVSTTNQSGPEMPPVSRRTAPPDIDAAIVARATDFFLKQLLAYTLTPPLLGPDSVDEFLFDTRKGFCEHFASAFVVAMRAAGVPARVVAGYQGGELNPVDGYLVVRQYDAHAWAEVWLAGRGWVRIDPTAITMPRRIADNFATAAPVGEPLPLLARADLAWLRELRNRVDAIANGWNQLVLGYNASRQRELLQRLGIAEPDWQRMTALLATVCGVMMLLLTSWVLWQRQKTDPALRLWRRFAARLARRGIRWQPWEGPLDFARRAGEAWPTQAVAINAFAQAYARLRYGTDPANDRHRQLAHLRHAVRAF